MCALKILYPHDYFNEKKIEEDFKQEYNVMSVYFSAGVLKTNHICEGDNVLYRGWMVNKEEYEDMNNFVKRKGASLIIPYQAYESNHYFEGWYSTVKSHSIESVVFKDKEEMFKNLPDWSSYFIKDAVKSLTTSKGSIAKNESEIKEILTEIEKYKGVERYIVLRKVIELVPDTEKRYFCVKGKVFSSSLEESIPHKVKEIGYLLRDRLFVSIDTCKDVKGKSWLIEIGDGQVSDLKEWKPESFIRVIKEIETTI